MSAFRVSVTMFDFILEVVVPVAFARKSSVSPARAVPKPPVKIAIPANNPLIFIVEIQIAQGVPAAG